MRSSSTKTAQMINFKLCTHISNRLLHKIVPVFYLLMSCSFFIAIIRRVLKAYFPWKQSKADYSKNIQKEKIAGTVLFVPWLVTCQWKKIIENCNSVGGGAHKVGKVISFWLNFDPNFTDIWRPKKKANYMY